MVKYYVIVDKDMDKQSLQILGVRDYAIGDKRFNSRERAEIYLKSLPKERIVKLKILQFDSRKNKEKKISSTSKDPIEWIEKEERSRRRRMREVDDFWKTHP